MKHSWSRLLRSLIVIGTGVSALASLTFVAIDLKCSADIERWAPRYPNATVVSETRNSVGRAVGATTIVLSSPDDAATVRRWYYALQYTLEQDQTPRGLATTDYKVLPNSNGGGSLIDLYSECAQ